LASKGTLPVIGEKCMIVSCLLDDLRNPEIRRKIPKDVPVITVTETGNRDTLAIQYLAQFGYRNIKGLLFGMRGWIKQNFPMGKGDPADR
jgi:rhodanese-related sulfurtransferase